MHSHSESTVVVRNIFFIYTCCEKSCSHILLTGISAAVPMSALHAMNVSKATVAQKQLSIVTPQWEEASWHRQLRQTLLGQPKTQLNTQFSPTDSWLWGLRKTITVCLRTTPWAPCPISFHECVSGGYQEYEDNHSQFLGLRRQAILDLHSLECYITLVYYVTFTSYILQLHLRKIGKKNQKPVRRITLIMCLTQQP